MMIRELTGLVTWPAVAAHEATHAALAWPWAEEMHIHLGLTGAAVSVDWKRSGWLVGVSHLGPTLLGLFVGIIATVAINMTELTLNFTGNPALTVAMGVYWAVYTMPSAADCDLASNNGRKSGRGVEQSTQTDGDTQ